MYFAVTNFKKRMVYTFGETIFDILYKDNIPVKSLVGGSLLNTSINLARRNILVSFCTELAEDTIGKIETAFLLQNRVDLSNCYFYNGKSAVALAFLNEQNDASYSFYKYYPELRFNQNIPLFSNEDIFMFGSMNAFAETVVPILQKWVHRANENQCLVYYDINFRKNLQDTKKSIILKVENNILNSDIIKGSDEDFKAVFETNDCKYIYEQIVKDPSKMLILTRNSKAVQLVFRNQYFEFEVPVIVPVSTIGAGDAFNAGFITSMVKNNVWKSNLSCMSEIEILDALKLGVIFATEVCLSFDNYVCIDQCF